MYSRSTHRGEYRIPEHYSGVAFRSIEERKNPEAGRDAVGRLSALPAHTLSEKENRSNAEHRRQRAEIKKAYPVRHTPSEDIKKDLSEKSKPTDISEWGSSDEIDADKSIDDPSDGISVSGKPFLKPHKSGNSFENDDLLIVALILLLLGDSGEENSNSTLLLLLFVLLL